MESLKGLLASIGAFVCIAFIFIADASTTDSIGISGAITASYDVSLMCLTCLCFATTGHEMSIYITVDHQLFCHHDVVRGIRLDQNRTSAAVAGKEDGYQHHHHHHC
ncbi:hypothetical protein Csa_008693 [Cucumis sativus]|nr:hypothetical protein Csa_008693 [Cucumis sativus]